MTSNPNSTQQLLLKSQLPIHKLNGCIELRQIKDLGLRWVIELAMMSDEVLSGHRSLRERGDDPKGIEKSSEGGYRRVRA